MSLRISSAPNSGYGLISDMMKYYIIIIGFLFFSSNIYSQFSRDEVENRIDDILKDEFFNTTTIAVDVYDLTTGEYIYQVNEHRLLNPASNMKLLTSAAGLIFLGPGYNFVTSLQYTGEIVNNTLYGDLYVIGGFDPMFSTADLNQFIKDIKKAGIKEISGNIYGDVSKKDSVFWGRGWMWDDDPSTDVPYLSALNINSNSIDVYVTGSVQGMKPDVRTDPATDYVNIINTAVTSTVDPQHINITRDWRNRKNDIYVSGYILPVQYSRGDTVETSVNVFRPDFYFLSIFKEHLVKSGIKVSGKLDLKQKPNASKWLSVFSRSYDSVMTYMNKKSDNLCAEMVLYSLAASFNIYPVTARQGIDVIDSLLTLSGVLRNNYILVDGSGLSRYNLISAEQVLSVLKYMFSSDPYFFNIYLKSLPVAGVDGTLGKRMIGTDAYGKVYAKTGTLKGVSCLSGYVMSKNNHMLAFSILEQNFLDQTAYARYLQDKICQVLAEYK